MRRRLLRVAVVAGLGIAAFSYVSLESGVTVLVEGRPVAVRTYARTVGDALARAGIVVGPKDRVIPPLDAPLAGRIEVRRAKPVTLLLDGKPRRVIVTGLTIDQVLDEISLRDTLADVVRPSRGSRVRPGMTISHRRAAILTVRHDGRTERVITNSTTVGRVIRELGISLGPRDRLVPGAAAAPQPGMEVQVLRVGLRREVDEVRLPFRTILRRDRHMLLGTRKVLRSGSSGLRRLDYLSKYVEGERVSRRLLKAVTLRAPSHRVIAIGSSYPGCICDRGMQVGKGTWYSQADGLTAAHRTLPFGTVVRVENRANGRWVNVVIRDRGPWRADRIIDLSDEAFRRIASLGTGVIDVRIRW